MKKPRADRTQRQNSHYLLSTIHLRRHSVPLLMMLSASWVLMSACGTSSQSAQSSAPLSGNWQFTMAAPSDRSFSGGMQGGFLLQNNGSVTGQVVYSIAVAGSPPTPCDGSAAITGTVSGQNVTLMAVAGTQTFNLTGSLSSDGKTLTGTYSTVATPSCGTAQTGLAWSAMSIPPLTGAVQGSFHSTGPPSTSRINQDFAVTGVVSQGPNIGASSATITGTLTFQGYPCLDTASVNGQISGSSVILQIIAPNGLNVGRIGSPPNSSTAPGPVAFQSSAAGGYILQGPNAYGVSTTACLGNPASPGDEGNVCLELGNSTACTQLLSLTPAFLTFPAQPVGSSPTTQTVTLTNTGASGATLNGLQLSPTGNNFTPSDFNGVPNFSEQDNCSATPGSIFSLGPQQSCTITISFSPQQSCPWLPAASLGGLAPAKCPPFLPLPFPQITSPPALSATLSVTCTGSSCSTSADPDTTFAVPISGFGTSAIQPSTPELDFGAEDATLKEVSPPQSVSFSNQGGSPIQILPAVTNPPCGSPGQSVLLPRPPTAGSVPGIQVVTGSITLFPPTVQFICDVDATSGKANFQIVPGSDMCSGAMLAPGQSCSLAVTYAPQPGESAGGLDYFLELNTQECTSVITTDCEIDSGRFPVELKSSLASPLRVSPGAGLDFGTWSSGQTSYPPLAITLSSDNSIANPQTINFTGNILKGDYAETDNCGISLAPGSSCTMSITFTPKVTGFDPGSITIAYNNGQTQVIYLRGFGQ